MNNSPDIAGRPVNTRTVMIGSQKGGVGKTTTTINLGAAFSERGKHVLVVDTDPVSSVAASLHLEVPDFCGLERAAAGNADAILRDVEPGLDVLPCSPTDFRSDVRIGGWIQQLGEQEFEDPYDLILVDSSPYTGPRSRDLLCSADELLLVIRAEPLSYRTLPSFLHDLRRLDNLDLGPNLRGIILTLPQGEPLGGRWENGLRNRFGSRMMPQAVPYDSVVGYSLAQGLPVVISDPESVPAQQYLELAAELEQRWDEEEANGVVPRSAA
ncbi:ParA family protein [Planctomycetes bacterium Poly30]|uniref:ParA family protein n=1 Tax=Saltatorellus ferox TaxID=2528018 RepID=UPI0011A804B4